MANASKLASLPAHLPDIPELPISVSDVADRLRDAGGAATEQVRRARRQTRRAARRARAAAERGQARVGLSTRRRRRPPKIWVLIAAVAGVGVFAVIRRRRSATGPAGLDHSPSS
jgi:hypothetical protein